ncbi:uncharacterized protein [Bos taurus]|uniref:uncharacterized protein isoform X6 n=1 Tax=Bos taurus TaxID=9913 RepID=UPI0028CB178B|nr:uncharacterized protein LOC104970180 isoform X6 [Bos taurus]
MAGRPTQARPHPPAHPSSLRRFVATPTCRIARARQRCRQAQPGRSSFLTCADYPRPRMLGEDLEWYLLFPARLPPSSDYGCLLMSLPQGTLPLCLKVKPKCLCLGPDPPADGYRKEEINTSPP